MITAISVPFLLIFALFGISPIGLTLSHYVGAAPQTFRATVRVEKHPDNRLLCTWYDGPSFRRSCRQLAGEESARLYQIWFKDVSAGEYEAAAEVTRLTDGRIRRYRAMAVPFRVIGLEF